MTAQRTYWHLEGLRRRPSDYELATTGLLYYPARGFATATPLAAWYREHQAGSPLQCADWDGFHDPRATTYAAYTALQRDQEAFVARLLADDGAAPSPPWRGVLDQVLAPLRYPVHGLQMIAGYVGSMAPGGRIVVACALQAGDELRRVQAFAYRLRQLQALDPALGAAARTTWERADAWQPWRRVIEQLLVTYDWGEALIALEAVVKPGFDALFGAELARLARTANDDGLAGLLRSLGDDAGWHRAWSTALIDHAVAARPENATVIAGWIARWWPPVLAAIDAMAPVIAGADAATVRAAVVRAVHDHWAALPAGCNPGAPDGR